MVQHSQCQKWPSSVLKTQRRLGPPAVSANSRSKTMSYLLSIVGLRPSDCTPIVLSASKDFRRKRHWKRHVTIRLAHRFHWSHNFAIAYSRISFKFASSSPARSQTWIWRSPLAGANSYPGASCQSACNLSHWAHPPLATRSSRKRWWLCPSRRIVTPTTTYIWNSNISDFQSSDRDRKCRRTSSQQSLQVPRLQHRFPSFLRTCDSHRKRSMQLSLKVSTNQ